MSYFQGARENPARSPSPQLQSPQMSNRNRELAAPESLKATARSDAPFPSTPIAVDRMRYYQWFMGIFFALHFSYLLYLQTRSDVADNRLLRVISDLLVLLGALVCTLICAFVAQRLFRLRRNATDLVVRRAWLAATLLGCSVGAYAIGQAIWTAYEAVYPSSTFPYPAAYDFFYLAVYPFSWAGIAQLVPRRVTVAGQTRLVLDAATAVIAFLAITWYFILGPTISNLSGSALEKFVSLAYPLGDLSLCIAAAILLFGTPGSSALNATLGRLALGVTVLAATDSLYGYFQLQGVYHTGFLQDIGWPMSWLFIGWAMLFYINDLGHMVGQRRSSAEEGRSSRLNRLGAATRAIAPMLIALGTCALLLLVVALRNTAPLMQVVLVCAGIFLLPVIRQALTLTDNTLLNERLRIALDQSQQAFQQSQQDLLTTLSRAELYEELRASIENLQMVHAALARGDMTIRARVQGPLSPVAQSLNLLIERMNRWSQVLQQNRVLESEAAQLAQAMDTLSQGHLLAHPPSTTPSSSFSTGAALLGTWRLQRLLQMRFHRLHELVDLLSSRIATFSQTVARLHLTLESPPVNQQQAEQLVMQLEKGLANSQGILQELRQQTHLFQSGGAQENSAHERQ